MRHAKTGTPLRTAQTPPRLAVRTKPATRQRLPAHLRILTYHRRDERPALAVHPLQRRSIVLDLFRLICSDESLAESAGELARVEGVFLPFDGVVEFVFLRGEELGLEARGAGGVVVVVGRVWDFAVFVGGWEAVEADDAGPVFGWGGHVFFGSE